MCGCSCCLEARVESFLKLICFKFRAPNATKIVQVLDQSTICDTVKMIEKGANSVKLKNRTRVEALAEYETET